ncbi:hypothetical protein [Runella slithyformis]|uniref:Uncharacterized protein n=1 Tax=Runella slithyformis (strain ATCC 29530 / DSM 19594 / LMG 11500 / NCIMB 11436 / LSU 4) TaxID=761193 RepID=A0A7U3ZLB5_RUNSL|nr:hypothetical protein [Runella slithyformis]AEI49317.1 hypothetical protein Runsl_2929 [Runella slithyformis DSM 19594]
MSTQHTFHIPVMGLGFTMESPIKVARFGITSVISIIEDELMERLRELYSPWVNESFVPITTQEEDWRAKRIQSYLNLVNRIVKQQVETLRNLPFTIGNEIVKYFELLPDTSPVKQVYRQMMQLEEGEAKQQLQQQLRGEIKAGPIDVNIMAKVDRNNYTKDGEMLPKEFSDALSSLRGFAQSDLESSVVFSAGYNPRLYGYIDTFSDFFPDETGYLKKKIVLKVSDYRSALTQGKILAKKGLWISEFRIESGLNCGGHAFATDGLLLGPIMEEFKNNREALASELWTMCNQALTAKGVTTFVTQPALRITVQGGIGTANENAFLLDYYQADATGWGSPFLLVPEATSVDEKTLHALATAKPDDYYLSHASPLGIPFNNFRKSSAQHQLAARIAKNRPGSPCYKKFLVANTEFTEIPICAASRQYQHLKINQLKEQNLLPEAYEAQLAEVTEKDCLCEGLGASALLSEGLKPAHNLNAVTICPGPNLAYFSGVFTLQQMVDHIYGRLNLLNSVRRSNFFVNELQMYVKYFDDELKKSVDNLTTKKVRYLQLFQTNLLQGVAYYKELIPSLKNEAGRYLEEMKEELNQFEEKIKNMSVPVPVGA